jgi:thiosulfate dehydrogenase [quinone] large subunit
MHTLGNYTKWQLAVMVALRFLIGWHLLYEGIYKLLRPEWSSRAFLEESGWILSGFADWVISNEGVLNAVDLLNTWGLMAIGLGLILGIFTRWAAYAGAALLLLYYLQNPPLTGLEYSLPSEGNYLVINKTLIEAVTLIAIALFPTSNLIGLDRIIQKATNKEVRDE